MRRISSLCGMLVLLVAGREALAQGLYLPSQTSGVEVTGGASTNEDATTLSVSGGYSYKALLDVGLSLSRYIFDTPIDMSAIGVQPYATYRVLRQGPTIPIAVAATASFGKRFYSVSDPAFDVSGWSMFLGGSAYRRFEPRASYTIIPEATLGYLFTHTAGAAGLFKRSRDDSTLLLRLAGNFGYQDRGGRIWGFTPAITFDADYVTFSAVVGATFPLL